MKIKPLIWLGDSVEQVRGFADDARGQGRHGACAQSIQGAGSRPKTVMTSKLKVTRGSGNVFADVGFGGREAENLLLRAQLMSRICDEARGGTQREAAKKFGVSQPRLNDLMRGKIDKFSLDSLVNMLAHAGMRIELRVKKAA